MERGRYRPSSSDRGQRKAGVLKLYSCAVRRDQTFPALFEEKEPSKTFQKKNEKTSVYLSQKWVANPPLPPKKEGLFDIWTSEEELFREVFLDDSSFAHSLSLLLFSKLFSSKRVNGVES